MVITFRVDRLTVGLDASTLAIANRYLAYLEGAQQKEIDALTAQVVEITARERDSSAKLQTSIDNIKGE